jgi:ribonuclease E
MKGATHNLVVRTRTDVALYVLNHKRGHLRDLESSFKVTLSVIADPTVSGQQSFVIDRGEQVHTLEAAKALLAAQVAASPPQIEEVFDDEEPFDVETEMEAEETEGPTEGTPVGEASGGEGEADGRRRKRRRRRRGRSGEAREGGPARDENDVAAAASGPDATAETTTDEGDTDEEESDDQPGMVRADQPAGGERRPRRRGRRGGRRRRGGPDDGLAGSIADELGSTSAPEAANAVADFDGYSAQGSSPALAHSEAAPSSEPTHVDRDQEAVRSPSEVETAQEAERTARRRSTVREKVSFLTGAQPEAPTAFADPSQAEPSSSPAQTAAESASAPAENSQPRRAGWWSRRFGNGE